MTAADIEQLIQTGLPAALKAGIKIDSVNLGETTITIPFTERMLRPGNRISGPTLFTAADTAMYACVLAHTGPKVMAVTADMNIHFLRAATPGDVTAKATLLKLGRKLAVIHVHVFTGGNFSKPVAFASGTYAIPS